MENEATAKRRQKTRLRVFWFLVGGVVNYLLISTPYQYLVRQHEEMPGWAKASLSLAVSTSFFFFWNYFVNFRTDSRKRDAFKRYLTATIILWGIASALFTAFKSFKGGFEFHIGKVQIDLDVITLQLCLGWLKFIVYHKWAFPAVKETSDPLPEREP